MISLDYLIYDCFLNQDPRDYFDSQQVNAIKALGDAETGIRQLKFSVSKEEAFCSLKDSISEINSQGLIEPIISPDVALKVFLLFF